MPKKDENNPFETLMGKKILENIKNSKDQDFAQLVNAKLDNTFEQHEFHKQAVDEIKRRQGIANEAAMKPLLIRLDEIIMLLREILDKM